MKRRRVRRTIFTTLFALIAVVVGWIGFGMPGHEYVSGVIPHEWLTYAANIASTLLPDQVEAPVGDDATPTATLEEIADLTPTANGYPRANSHTHYHPFPNTDPCARGPNIHTCAS